ncbi:MAG: hypothetical protein LBS59_08420 [Puniceicoccales bacterium]|nr:hypothetical protein [Puniceicoccales bacterium]
MSTSNEKNPPTGVSVPAWVLGVVSVVGVCCAFFGGWHLAKQSDKPRPPVSSHAIKAAEGAPAFPVSEVKANTKPAGETAPAPAPSPPPVTAPDNAGRVEVASVAKTARMDIATQPNARVSIVRDGAAERALGTADANGRFDAAEAVKGETDVSLIFEHIDCEKVKRDGVRLVPGKTVHVNAPLRLRPATFTIITNPARAEVLLDGVSIGRGVVTLGDIAPRVPHTVEVRLSGGEPARREVVFAPGESALMRVNITPPPSKVGDILFLGAMRTLVTTKGVTIRVDGKVVAAPDGLARDIAVGARKIEIIRDSAVVWSRTVKVEAGVAASFGDVDAPPPPLTAAELKMARVVLSLLDRKGVGVPVANAKVSFRDKPLVVLKNGTWPVPTGIAGTLRVSVSGFAPEEHPLNFRVPGEYYVTCILQPAPEPAMKKWNTAIKAVSRENGVIVLRDIQGQVLDAGLRLELVPPVTAAAVGVLRIAVIEVKGGNVVCQILPGQGGMALPIAGDVVTVVVARRQPAK